MSRIGVLGGSFDPVHLGHLWIATFAREALALDRVLLIPAAVPPHKGEGTVAPYPFRLELLERLVPARPWLVASDLEADGSQPSFTVETLRRLKAQLAPADLLWLLLGADSLHDIPHWREPEEILRLARIAVYQRPGAGHRVPDGIEVDWVDGPACGLSSTLIRRRIVDGKSIKGMVPEEILDRLTSSGLYTRTGSDV